MIDRVRATIARVGMLIFAIPFAIVIFNRLVDWIAGELFLSQDDCPATECLICTLAINPMVETLIFQCVVGHVFLLLGCRLNVATFGSAAVFGAMHYWAFPSWGSVLSAAFAGLLFSSVYTRMAVNGHWWRGIIDTYLAHASTNTLVWLLLPGICRYRWY